MIASVTTRAIRMETRCAWMAGSEKIVTLVCIDLDRPRDEMGQQTSFSYNYLSHMRKSFIKTPMLTYLAVLEV